MELIYRNDIRWQDLPKIESPFFAQSKVEDDLTSPLPDITSGIGRNPLSKIVNDFSGKVNNDALKKLLTKIEEGVVVLVHYSVDDVFRPVFKWEKDDQHPNKGYWSINNCYDTQALFEFEWVLRTVKKPQPRGSVKTNIIATAPEYGYIPSTSSMAETAETVAKTLWNIGKRTPVGAILATLAPSSAGGTTTYELAEEPGLRITESPTQTPYFQRRVNGEWQSTGVKANTILETDGDVRRVVGFEALSPEEIASIKITGGMPIPPQAKPTLEGYPPDSPPDSSNLTFPEHRDESDNSTMSYPGAGPGSIASPGFNAGTDARDVVGSSVMYNQSEGGDTEKLEKDGILSDSASSIDFDGHVFKAEVKSNGSVVGGHSTVTGDVRVIPGTATVPNAQGIYSARIEVADPNNEGQFLPKTNNGGVSTMFPDSWSTDQVKMEVESAYRNRTVVGNKWTGITPSGVNVEGFIIPKTTVYPKL